MTPLILATTNFVLLLGIIAPGGAYIVINPSFAFAAPHTTFLISFSPTLTSQTLSRSALGCFSVLMIFATLNNSFSEERLSTLSTSNPILVNCSKRFFRYGSYALNKPVRWNYKNTLYYPHIISTKKRMLTSFHDANYLTTIPKH